jgi:hypothetical protein
MRVAASIALVTAVLAGGCGFSLDEKNGCRTSADCLSDRICLEGACTDHSCDELCLRACDAMVECGAIVDDCVGACAGVRPTTLDLLPLDPAVCKSEWDAYQQANCEVIACRVECDVMCSRGHECGHVVDEMQCRQGCWLDNPTLCDPDAVAAASCEDLRVDARCAEARGEAGADIDCSLLPCRDDYDCDPSETCEYGGCRQRCLEDEECGDGDCFVDWCTDPVGTPCDDNNLYACGGGSCINVDAANQTTSYYCTRSCFDWQPCPAGYSCVDYDCRK